MGELHTIKTSDWRKFLTYKKLHFHRIKGDHEIWVKEGLLRPVVFRTNEKEIPIFHIKTNLKTIQSDMQELRNFLKS